jgi:MPBQ/MSBQ methyltransferase
MDMRQIKLKDYVAYRGQSDAPPGSFDLAAIGKIYDGIAKAAVTQDSLPRFLNHGYWEPDTKHTVEASENLMARIVEGVRLRSSRGTQLQDQKVLDVACGLGGTTRYLSSHWPADAVYGINITEPQLEVCRHTAPECHFALMDAARLEFQDEFFDHIVCIEAAFHFNTRRAFLAEAYRVLKPGGVLAMTDALMVPEIYDSIPRLGATMPRENQLASIEAYEAQLQEIGFRDCEVRDMSEQGWKRYFPFNVAHFHKEWVDGRLPFSWLQRMLDALYVLECTIDKHLLCFAVK